jgi:hypothetical protein
MPPISSSSCVPRWYCFTFQCLGHLHHRSLISDRLECSLFTDINLKKQFWHQSIRKSLPWKTMGWTSWCWKIDSGISNFGDSGSWKNLPGWLIGFTTLLGKFATVSWIMIALAISHQMPRGRDMIFDRARNISGLAEGKTSLPNPIHANG